VHGKMTSSKRNVGEAKAMCDVKEALSKFLPAGDITLLSAYTLQASRLPDGMTVPSSQGSQYSVVLYGLTSFGHNKESIKLATLNVALTRAIDLFILITSMDLLNTNSKKNDETATGDATPGVRGLKKPHMPLSAFLHSMQLGDIESINQSLQESLFDSKPKKRPRQG